MTSFEKQKEATINLKRMIQDIEKVGRLQGSVMDEKCNEAISALVQAQEKMNIVLAEMEHQSTW